MNWKLFTLGTLAASVAVWFLGVRFSSRTGPPEGPLILSGYLDDEEHLVTPEMLEQSQDAADRPIPTDAFAEDADGRSQNLSALADADPLLIVFIKDGCPCSTSAEPFFQRLFDAYGDRVRFLGVIDGDRETARSWADRHGTPYPLLLDPDLELVRAFEVGNSAYVAVIARGGRIETLWPGYSAGMLTELSEQLARLGGTKVVPIEVDDAPELLYSGCPFLEEPPAS
ncbi:hypothetical protein BH23PLA1_BH23PLA1_10410 [soil metagenome]